MDRSVLVHSLRSVSVSPFAFEKITFSPPSRVVFLCPFEPSGVSVVYFDEREILVHQLSVAEGNFPNDVASMLHNVVRDSR